MRHTMVPSMVLILFSLLIATPFVCQGATFQAELVDSKNKSEIIGSVTGTVDGDEWTWSMDVSSPVVTAQIADRRGSATDPLFRSLVTLVEGTTPADATEGALNGTFGSKDVMTENAPDLFKNASIPAGKALGGHMCMGHIFAVANGTDGQVYTGAMTYMGEGDCYDAAGVMSMGSHHSADMDMDMEMEMDMDTMDMVAGQESGKAAASGSHMFDFSAKVVVSSVLLALFAAC